MWTPRYCTSYSHHQIHRWTKTALWNKKERNRICKYVKKSKNSFQHVLCLINQLSGIVLYIAILKCIAAKTGGSGLLYLALQSTLLLKIRSGAKLILKCIMLPKILSVICHLEQSVNSVNCDYTPLKSILTGHLGGNPTNLPLVPPSPLSPLSPLSLLSTLSPPPLPLPLPLRPLCFPPLLRASQEAKRTRKTAYKTQDNSITRN